MQHPSSDRQMVGAYERRARQPSVESLARLLAGCGMRLRLVLVPQPGLEDEPTVELLSLPPLQRLDPAQQAALVRLADAAPTADQLLLGGKAAARLQGAVIGVPELEILVNGACAPRGIEALLRAAGVEYLSPSGGCEPVRLTEQRLHRGCVLALDGVELLVRAPDHYGGMKERATVVQLFSDLGIPVTTGDDCAATWHPRDLDHLALQRAWRLSGWARSSTPP